MKKLLINFTLTALTFGMISAFNAMAVESEATSSIKIGEDKSISLTTENALEAGITAVSFKLEVNPAVADAIVSFDFNPENEIKVTDFVWHENNNTMSIYMADENPIFSSDTLNIGAVSAKDTATNENVEVTVTVVKGSLEIVSQGKAKNETLDIDIQNNVETRTEIPQSPFGTPGEAVPVEVTTTTTTSIKGDSKSVTVEKTYPTSYLITIPDSTDTLDVNDRFVASAENVLIEHGKSLKLSVESNHSWELRDKNNPENKEGIAYRMGYGDKKTVIESDSQTIMTLTGNETGDVALTVISINKEKMAGTFFDTLTFRVEIS
ncbi:MAG: hypothetical protein NC340_06880 [Ruminococcus flavefaciens]|nr:hypothetical protein [Ruminococcus flavefaciens]MCM1230420.1 hypothetical protein [Ruminococcus flavefaciens]